MCGLTFARRRPTEQLSLRCSSSSTSSEQTSLKNHLGATHAALWRAGLLFFFSEMRREGPSGNNLKSINSSPLKCPGFKRVVWVFCAAVMELLSMLRDLAAGSLRKRAERSGLEDDNLLKSSFCFSLLLCSGARNAYKHAWEYESGVCEIHVLFFNILYTS